MAETSVWSQVVVDRRDATSPYRQIANSIRHKIATNQIPPGTVVPSVRAMAESVGVTPATAARAYRQLQADGLLESIIGVGTVVGDTAHLVYQARERSARDLARTVEGALGQLLQSGYAPDEIRAAVDAYLARERQARTALVVADATPVLEKYLAIMRRELTPLGVRVSALRLAELREGGPAAREAVATASRVLTALGLLRPVQEALDALGAAPPVSIIFTELSLATVERLGSLAPTSRTLVVAEERYRNSILGMLRQHLPPEQTSVLHVLEPAALEREAADHDVIVHSLGTSELVRAVTGPHHDVILMDYQVRADAMAKLRESFLPDAVLAPA